MDPLAFKPVDKTSFEASQEVGTTKPRDVAPPKDLTERCLKLFEEGHEFTAVSKQLLEVFKERCPEQAKETAAFTGQHANTLTTLREKGWASVKADKSVDMKRVGDEGVSYETFRKQAVDLVQDSCLAMLKAMGHDESRKSFSAFGTVGWDSDIDTVFSPQGPMSMQMQVLTKAMFDVFFKAFFHELPGKLLDTECYVRHPGEAFATENQLSETTRQAFSLIEEHAFFLQACMQMRESPELWKGVKETILRDQTPEVPGSPREAPSLDSTFADIEGLADCVTEAVESGIENKYQMMMRVARDIDQQTQRIDHIDSEVEHIDQAIEQHRKNLRDLDKDIAATTTNVALKSNLESSKELLQQSLDRLLPMREQLITSHKDERARCEVARARAALLILSCEDEGYLTQGAYRRVCEVKGGQKYQRSVETSQKKLEGSMVEGLLPLDVAIQGGLFLKPAQRLQASPQENMSSMMENWAMYRGHFQKKESHTGSALEALIATSKYSQRALAAAYALMDQLGIPESITAQRSGLKELLFETAEQELAKRGKWLNYSATVELLVAQIASNFEKELEKELGKEHISETVQNVLQETVKVVKKAVGDAVTEAGLWENDTAREDSMLSQDYYGLLETKLKGHLLAKDFEPELVPNLVNTPEIMNIMKARAGFYQQDDKAVLQVLSEGRKMTKARYTLDNDSGVETFNKHVDAAVLRVFQMAMQADFARTAIPIEKTFTGMWRETMQGGIL